MFSDPVSFTWERPRTGGYNWQPTASSNDLVLLPRPGTTFGSYHPLDEPVSLYRELATVDIIPEGTLAFADRYGHLGGGAFDRLLRADTFEGWRRTLAWLKEAVRIWDLRQKAEEDDAALAALGEAFRWTGERVDYVFSPPLHESLGEDEASFRQRARGVEHWFKGYDLLGTKHTGLTPGLRVRPGDLLRPATLFVLTIINEFLPSQCGPFLQWDAAKHRIVYADMPFNLCGAVWFQFGHAVHSGSLARRCPQCGRWFEVAQGTNRTDRVFCSNSCRSKNYQERRQRAAELRASGMSARRIAKELGTEEETVKGWLKHRKEK
jgi:hypothetical protein